MTALTGARRGPGGEESAARVRQGRRDHRLLRPPRGRQAVAAGQFIQGDPSGRLNPVGDLVPTVLAAGGPLL